MSETKHTAGPLVKGVKHLWNYAQFHDSKRQSEDKIRAAIAKATN